MKKLILMFLAVVATLVACNVTPEPQGPTIKESIELMCESVTFQAEGAAPQEVEVVLENCTEWDVTVLDGEWLTVEKIEADSIAIQLTVTDNLSDQTRETVVYVSGATATAELTVTQLGIAPALVVEPTKVEFASEGGKESVSVTSNVEWEATTSAEWLTVTQDEAGVTITAEQNPTTDERKATVKVATEFSLSATIEVVQAAAAEPVRIRDNEACFVPYTEVIYEDESRKGYDITNVFDDNLDTYWSCPNSGIEENAVLTFVFDGRYRIDYMEYFPSPDYGQWGEFSIKYKLEDSKKYETLGDFNFGMKDGKQTLDFGKSLIGVVELVIEVKSAKGRSVTTGLLAGASEIEFFYSDDVYYKPIELFEDESCSVFKNPKFSDADLDKIQDSTLRAIAEIMLYRDAKDNEFRVANYHTYPHPDVDAEKYHTSQYSKLDNVTGILFYPGRTYTVCVSDDGRQDVSPRLVVTNYKWKYKDYSDRNPGHFGSSTQSFNLRTGINHITIPENVPANERFYGGLCYLEYFSNSKVNVKVNFVDGEVNGYWDSEMHGKERFEEMLNKSIATANEELSIYPHMDMRSPEVIMTFGSDLIQQHTRDGVRAMDLMQVLDSIVWLEEQLQGHHLYNTGAHANRMRMKGAYGGSYMYAGSYETGYDVSSWDCQLTVLDYYHTRRGCWGIAHEMGHVNQVRKGLKWIGTSEVTNNICSAYVQFKLNGQTQLSTNSEHVGFWGAFSDIMARGCSHVLVGSWDEAYYLKVVPFWQLYLYFTEVKGMTDFYPTIYHTVRNYPDCTTMSDEEAMLRFCELVSDVAKLDMTEFFERWGFLTPVEGVWFNDYGKCQIFITQERIDKARAHMAQYPKPEQPIHFITEKNIGLYKQPVAATVGKVAHTKKTTKYHFQGWENCVAYVVEGTDGKLYGIRDAAEAAFVFTEWNEFSWADRDGNIGANSEVYYCTVGKNKKSKTESNTPALDGAKYYGVDVYGVWHEAK